MTSAPVEVVEAFQSHPPAIRDALLSLRRVIWQTVAATEGVGEVSEVLRWGQPSYITAKPRTGSTFRLGALEGERYALFFHCQTTLVERFRVEHGDTLKYEGNRALWWNVGEAFDEARVAECVRAALLYRKRRDG
ncbi:MAG: DUF1801 domain-containing protein [Myxococcota bacterium]